MEMNDAYDDNESFFNQEDDYYETFPKHSAMKRNGNVVRVGDDVDNTSYGITVERNGKIVRTIQYSKVSKHVFDNVVSDMKREYPPSLGYKVKSISYI